ncbi:hypothetical protein ZOD2009_17548 [Haladaptatus paucihalophilus DX253]|uniref:Uncharacterized protein n=1 Tax=Haladaptatus paucihalophilus DX253 TaxID=797209 RepID=E7QXH1_HALPU|nr:hypothetical protein [Haladaptatus paucihalophilus]EFW90974.1 hypothetical protein ZOD2009_17548 [Haladaptatus paucihalophilus DX253]
MEHRVILAVAFCLVVASTAPTAATRHERPGIPEQQTQPGATHCFRDVTFRNTTFPAFGQNARNLHVEEAMSGALDGGTSDGALSVDIARMHAERICIGVKSTDDGAGVRLTFHDAVLKKTMLQGAEMRFERATADSISFRVPKRIGDRFRDQLGGNTTNDGGDDSGATPTPADGPVGDENRSGGPDVGDRPRDVGDVVNDTADESGDVDNRTDDLGNSTKRAGDGVDTVTDGAKDASDDLTDHLNDTTGNVTDAVDEGTDTVDNTTDGVGGGRTP